MLVKYREATKEWKQAYGNEAGQVQLFAENEEEQNILCHFFSVASSPEFSLIPFGFTDIDDKHYKSISIALDAGGTNGRPFQKRRLP